MDFTRYSRRSTNFFVSFGVSIVSHVNTSTARLVVVDVYRVKCSTVAIPTAAINFANFVLVERFSFTTYRHCPIQSFCTMINLTFAKNRLLRIKPITIKIVYLKNYRITCTPLSDDHLWIDLLWLLLCIFVILES